jgi:hypothetical protein
MFLLEIYSIECADDYYIRLAKLNGLAVEKRSV